MSFFSKKWLATFEKALTPFWKTFLWYKLLLDASVLIKRLSSFTFPKIMVVRVTRLKVVSKIKNPISLNKTYRSLNHCYYGGRVTLCHINSRRSGEAGNRSGVYSLVLHQWVPGSIPAPFTYVHLVSSSNMLQQDFLCALRTKKIEKIWSEGPPWKQWYTLSKATLSKYGEQEWNFCESKMW